MGLFQSFKGNGVNKEANGLLLGTLSVVALPGNCALRAAGGLVHPEVDGGLTCHMTTPNHHIRFTFLER